MVPSEPIKDSGDILRILVQTKTDLVPGNGYEERVENMRNLICQHHWKRDFDEHQDRWNVYGQQFGYERRTCYFLVDHGYLEPPGEPPTLWYRWTRDSLSDAAPQCCEATSQSTDICEQHHPRVRPACEDTIQIERVSILKTTSPALAKQTSYTIRCGDPSPGHSCETSLRYEHPRSG